ncbi:MAG: biopolymer transporter Tol [bacterium]
MKKFSFILIGILFFAKQMNAQFNEYEPEFNWLTIKGEHVVVHYHEEAERTARVVCKIADEVWEPLTTLYGYEPETVHYLIKDIDDYSNGATYFFDNKIEIWSSALDFDLRGTHNWLRNVISHEFTHMVQIQASMKMGRGIPALYLQFLNYEDKRRPDILYGYPNFIMSYPVATFNVPAWFAEGTAQYMRKEFDYDRWDTHRDMIIRSYALDDNMLTWNQMGIFSKTSLGNESVYNSGFALIKYISQRYGEDKLRELSNMLGKFSNFTIDAAIEDVLGITGNDLYNEWSEYLKKDYSERIKAVKENLVTGEQICSEGFGNFYPQYFNNGKDVLYISNQGMDYMSLTSLYKYNLETKENKLVAGSVRSSYGVIPGEEKIIYSKLSEDNPKWTDIHDLYIYDIKEDEETRITFGLRANNPSVSNDGKKVVFVFQKDGTTNLGTTDIDGKNFKKLTFFENGEQVYNPKFSPDDSYIIFDYSYHQTRDIAKVNVDGAGFEFVIQTDNDERNPSFMQNGRLIYACDETGIFNLYSYSLEKKEKVQLTNVTGSAFMPSADVNGNIVYAGYTSSGYKIFRITPEEQNMVDVSKSYVWKNNPPIGEDKPNGDMTDSAAAALKNFNDYTTPDYESKKYSGFFTSMTFYPFIRFDNYNTSNSGLDKIKPGLYISSTDMLNRYSLFAGASINKRFERDVFMILDYRDKLPLFKSIGLFPELALELYSVSRKTNADIFWGLDTTGGSRKYDYKTGVDVTYNLFEVDFAARHKIFAEGNKIEFRFIFSNYSATLGSFVIPNTSTLYPTTNDTYLIGRNLQVKYNHSKMKPYIDSDINPVGRKIELQYNYEFNRFNADGEYEVVDGMLKPKYDDFNFHRLELKWEEHMPAFSNHTITAQFRGATIFGPGVPDFFDNYLGGFIGMKAYPFYAVSGNELLWLNLTYQFPLFRDIDFRLGHIYLDKIFMSVYGDFGNAWTGEFPEMKDFKKGAGAEIRFKLNSFYMFPTSIFFNAAYAFDKFERDVNGEKIVYGKEWNLYGGILFEFSSLIID